MFKENRLVFKEPAPESNPLDAGFDLKAALGPKPKQAVEKKEEKPVGPEKARNWLIECTNSLQFMLNGALDVLTQTQNDPKWAEKFETAVSDANSALTSFRLNGKKIFEIRITGLGFSNLKAEAVSLLEEEDLSILGEKTQGELNRSRALSVDKATEDIDRFNEDVRLALRTGGGPDRLGSR